MVTRLILQVLAIAFASAGEVPGTFCTPFNLGRFSSGWPKSLDVGLYWFGFNDQLQKATSSGASQFYDPSKPTMIYFHGWTGHLGGWTRICKRLTTVCHPDMCPNGGGQFLADSWLKAGWNVGFFFWDQFADEVCVREAEQKIWFDRQGDGFRWKSFDVGSGLEESKVYEQPGVVSVADICMDVMKTALGNFKGSQVRFVGHSIGAQLAVRCASLLHVENHVAAPQRLALLEPFFSKHSHLGFFNCHAQLSTDTGLGDFAALATTAYIKTMWESSKVVTEIYKSSVLTEKDESSSVYDQMQQMVKHTVTGGFESTIVGTLGGGERNEDLEKHSAIVNFQPDWCDGVSGETGDMEHLFCRHCAVFPMYMLGFGTPSPAVIPSPSMTAAEPGSALSSCITPTASCTDGQIREWVQRQLSLNGGQMWKQISGSATFDLTDDGYSMSPGLDERLQLGISPATNEFVERAALESTVNTQESFWTSALRRPEIVVPVGGVVVLGVMAGVLYAFRHQSHSISEESEDEELQLDVSRSLMQGL
jgi:hypothetical protein